MSVGDQWTIEMVGCQNFWEEKGEIVISGLKCAYRYVIIEQNKCFLGGTGAYTLLL